MTTRALLGALLFCAPTTALADVVTIDADFSEHIRSNSTEYAVSPHAIGVNATHAFRTAIRFPLAGVIPAAAAVTKVELLVEVIEVGGNADELVKIGAYGSNGMADPMADGGALAFTNAAVANPYKEPTNELRTLGSKVVDISAAALDVEIAASGSSTFAVALQQVNETVGALRVQQLAAFNYSPSAKRPKLRITFSDCNAGDAVPADAYVGYINVKTDSHCMLKGDGVTDDTAAFQSCVSYWSDHRQRIDPATGQPGITAQSVDWLRFPKGTYVLSNQIKWVGGMLIGGKIGRAYTSLIGECPGRVKFKLAENTCGFTDPLAPKALLQVSHPETRATSYSVDIWNIDIEIGAGNFGAIGADWGANNEASMRKVNVRAAVPGECLAGLLLPEGAGPALLKDVLVDGCKTGIDSRGTYYSNTLENVEVRNNSKAGIEFTSGVMSIRKGKSNQPTGSPALHFGVIGNVLGPVVAVWDFEATGGAPGEAVRIETPGLSSRLADVYLRDFVLRAGSHEGYAAFKQITPAASFATLPADYSNDPIWTMPVVADPNVRLPAPGPLRLAFPDHPTMAHGNPADWAMLMGTDATATDHVSLIETAAATHKVVALNGNHFIGSTIDLCGAVERVVGFNQLFIAQTGVAVSPIFRVCDTMDHPILFENLAADPGSGTIPEPRVIVDGTSDIAMRDVLNLTGIQSHHGGDVLIENGCCGGISVIGGKLVAVQANVENAFPPHDIRVENGEAVVLGFKSELGSAGRHFQFVNSAAEVFGSFQFCSQQSPIANAPPVELIDSQAGLYGFAGYSICEWAPQISTTDAGVVRTQPIQQPPWHNRRWGWASFRHAPPAPLALIPPTPFSPVALAAPVAQQVAQ